MERYPSLKLAAEIHFYYYIKKSVQFRTKIFLDVIKNQHSLRTPNSGAFA